MYICVGIDDVRSLSQGLQLGVSPWMEMDQELIDRFADLTDDHQWIHVDRERAASGPFGRTIAHGFLTLSVMPALMREVYRVDAVSMAVNVGLDQVRFLSPVPVGSRIRLASEVSMVEYRGDAVRVGLKNTIEIEGTEKPACVAVNLIQYFA